MLLSDGIIVIFVLVVLQSDTVTANRTVSDQCPNLKTNLKLVRKRRHLTFPDGAAATITISLAKAVMTHAPSGWMLTSDLDVIFPLPDSKFTNAHFRRKLHHRQKKDLWERVQNALYMYNMDGYACVLRSICEAKTHLATPGRSLVHDLLRGILTAPLHEQEFIEEMGETYNELSEPNFCDKTDKVNGCPFSLLHFILEFNKQKY